MEGPPEETRTNKLECYTNPGRRGEFQMCNKSEIINNSKTIQFPRSKIWEALLATDQARSVMKQSSCVLVRRKGVWLTLWVRFRCFAIWQRPTPSPVSFRFIVVHLHTRACCQSGGAAACRLSFMALETFGGSAAGTSVFTHRQI